ncbi:hypothetical protein EDD22DRAFT_853529 [Suillus occidentalis]|nr:hypothetical protein EDD22DRAFT_853529 [Suillus occidentalis]
MSTPVQTSLASLKEATVKLVGIIAGTWHIPADTGEAHNVLTKQAYTLLGDIVWEHEKEDYIPGILTFCSKELMRTRLAQQDPCLGGVGTSGTMTSEFQDNRKDKAIVVNLEPEVKGSRKRKSPMISGHSPQPPKSAMKSCKHLKLKPIVELEDEEDTIVQLILCGVLEVVLPQPSTIVIRMPQLPCSSGSPKKQSFGPASMTASSRLEVIKSLISCPEAMPSDDTAGASDGEPPAIPTFDITIPSPIPQNNPCHYRVKEQWSYKTCLNRRSSHLCLSYVHCSSKKIRCQPASLGTLPKHVRAIPAVTAPKV